VARVLDKILAVGKVCPKVEHLAATPYAEVPEYARPMRMAAPRSRSVLALFNDWAPHLAPGEVATTACIATDRQQARALLRYIAGMLRSVSITSDMIDQEATATISSRRGAS
jgi:hypothetical protein